MPLYFVIAASALAWLVPVLWAHARQDARRGRRASHVRRRSCSRSCSPRSSCCTRCSRCTRPQAGFVKALQNEVFFYVPFAILLARLRDLDWSRELLIRCLLVTVGLAVAFSLIGFVEEATRR